VRGFRGPPPDAKRIRIQRPDDLLDLRLEWVNVSFFWKDNKAKIRIADPSNPAYLIVRFPAQHLLEQAFPGSDATTPHLL
jgi:hypothetical protein